MVNAQKAASSVSEHFPPAIRERLVRAAQTPVSDADPMARVRAIDDAIDWSRTRFPELFRWPAQSA